MNQNQQLARLLSGRDEPSVLEKEALFNQLQGRLPSQSSRFAKRFVALGGLSLLGAAAGAWLFLRTLSPHEPSLSGADEFASRGVARGKASVAQGKAGGVHASVRLACIDSGGRELSCAIGRTLVFEFESIPEEYQYFAAFAQTYDGTTLWYYPEATGQSPALERSNSLQNRAIQLVQPHAAGEYRVYSIFSRAPVTRADIKAALGTALVTNERLLVVERRITVQGER